MVGGMSLLGRRLGQVSLRQASSKSSLIENASRCGLRMSERGLVPPRGVRWFGQRKKVNPQQLQALDEMNRDIESGVLDLEKALNELDLDQMLDKYGLLEEFKEKEHRYTDMEPEFERDYDAPLEYDPENPMAVLPEFMPYYMDRFPNLEDWPEEFNGIKYRIERTMYPPTWTNKMVDKVQINRKKVWLFVEIAQLNFTEAQHERFRQIVGPRYNDKKDLLKLTWDKEEMSKDNIEQLKVMFSMIVQEARKV
mmetsp:Transcript_1063/g.1719  ORF Transcript_1063/g.1719 Transcript_1063/m.1719 type:complete len:252 (+) Transcript_1063:46-801(+)